MKFEIGETVLALHFDKQKYVYLVECLVIGIKSKPVTDVFTDNLSSLLVEQEIELYPIVFDEENSKYVLPNCESISMNCTPYFHPIGLVFRNKQEALFYLHGIVQDIAK